MKGLGLLLAQRFRKETRRRGGNKWAAQQQGRHVYLSGHWFIEALATARGWKAAASCTLAFRLPLAAILGASGAALDDDMLLRLLQAFRGVLLNTEPEGVGKTAGSYNSMGAGASVWLWAVYTGRISSRPLSEPVFRMALQAQRPGVRDVCRRWGVSHATRLELKRQALQQAVAHLPGVPGHSPAAPWKHDPREVFWPSVFVHFCEVSQVPHVVLRVLALGPRGLAIGLWVVGPGFPEQIFNMVAQLLPNHDQPTSQVPGGKRQGVGDWWWWWRGGRSLWRGSGGGRPDYSRKYGFCFGASPFACKPIVSARC